MLDGHEDLLGRPSVPSFRRIPPRVVESFERSDQVVPTTFRGRFYFDVVDRNLLKSFGETSSPSMYHRLEAVDVLISESANKDEYLVLISTRNDTQLRRHIFPGLTRLFLAISDSVNFIRDDTPMATSADGDIFRWLLYRRLNYPAVNASCTVLGIDAIIGRDSFSRSTSFSDGADLDRPEILTLLAQGSASFGPGKITLADDTADLVLSLELAQDGSFSLFRGKSEYGPDVEIDDSELGTRLIEDAAYRILPDLIHAYNSDVNWVTDGRESFKQFVLDSLGKVDYSI